jgi:rhodanese-related sulfurtransferase
MTKKGLRRLITLMLPVLLILTATLSSGCTEKENVSENQIEAPTQKSGFVTPLEASELIQRYQGNPNFVIIDDRPPTDFYGGHIEGAVNMPYGSDFNARLGNLDKNKIYLVYCPTGCGATSNAMIKLGFKYVYEIEGGLSRWKAAGLPIVK